jgi:hypothetical protein
MHYHICVKGNLDHSWQPSFAGLQIRNEAAGRAILAGQLPDQAALYGVLLKIDRLGLTLLAPENSEALIEEREALEEA